MAQAIKCDVLNCGVFQEGESGEFIDKEIGQAMQVCKTHTQQIMSQLFPDFMKKPEPEPTQPAQEEAQPQADVQPESAPVDPASTQ